MARSRTENFPAKVIERLRNRVGLRCSNPDCRRPTAAPGPGELGVTLVGEAAHIHAASAGGARYLASMSAEERRAIDNALWLCSICHTNVDRNPDRFDAALLKDWKTQAERSARTELGQRLPGPSDAQDLLLVALTGAPRHLPLNAIANVIGATELQLQALDPRFLVRTTYANGAPTHTIEALEPVRLSFKANNLGADTLAGLQSMFDHGMPVTMLAVNHGVIDLHDGKWRQAMPSDGLTCRAPIDYDPAATCPLWEKFILEVVGDNAQFASFLQRALGYRGCRKRRRSRCHVSGLRHQLEFEVLPQERMGATAA